MTAVPSLEEGIFDQYWLDSVRLLSSTDYGIALRIQPLSRPLLFACAYAQEDAGFVLLVRERIEATSREENSLVAAQGWQGYFEAPEHGFALKADKDMIFLGMRMHAVFAALRRVAMNVNRHPIGARQQILCVSLTRKLCAQAYDEGCGGVGGDVRHVFHSLFIVTSFSGSSRLIQPHFARFPGDPDCVVTWSRTEREAYQSQVHPPRASFSLLLPIDLHCH